MFLGDSSSEYTRELTKEEFLFKKKQNGFSFNHKDRCGLALDLLALLSFWFLLRGSCLFSSVLGAGLVACIMYEPIRILYMASALFALALRTPEFLELSEHFPGGAMFEEEATFRRLKSEVVDYLARTENGKNMKPTKDTFSGENEYIGSGGNGENQWRIFAIKVANCYANGTPKNFPTLYNLLQKNQLIVACILSVLEPRCKIPMHCGYYKGLMRFMVPLVIPKDGENVWLTVNGTKYHWEEGKVVLWDDTFPHAVYNDTDEVRVLLYMDVLRTKNMPQVAKLLNLGLVKILKATGIAESEIEKTEVKMKIR